MTVERRDKLIWIVIAAVIGALVTAAAASFAMPAMMATQVEVEDLDTRNSKEHEDIKGTIGALKDTTTRTDNNVQAIHCWITSKPRDRGNCIVNRQP